MGEQRSGGSEVSCSHEHEVSYSHEHEVRCSRGEEENNPGVNRVELPDKQVQEKLKYCVTNSRK